MSYDEEEDLMMDDDLENEDEPLDLPDESFDEPEEEEDPDNRYH